MTDNYDISLTVPSSIASERGVVEFQSLLFIRNMPMFIAIVVASAPTLGRHLVARVAFGLLLLAFLDGAVVAHMAWRTISVGSPPTSMLYRALSLPSVYSATGGMFIAPIFVGAVVGMWPPPLREIGECEGAAITTATSPLSEVN